MPLVHLIYTSFAVDAPSSRELMTILEASRRRNAADGVTGMLVYGGDLFLQLLEGPREAVCRTFYRILRDARHRDVTILQFGYPAQRRFAAWSMNYAGLGESRELIERLAGPDGFLSLAADADAAMEFMHALSLGSSG